MLDFLEKHIERQNGEPVKKNVFLGVFISKNKEAVQLFYELTRGQRYSTHRKAACKKFYEIAKKHGLQRNYRMSTSFDYEDKAANLISYNFL